MAAPYGKRVVTLRGTPIINEDGAASTTIVPGYLVSGVTSIAPQANSGTQPIPKAFALEREDMGTGIDSTYAQSNTGTASPNYASGDQVKVGVFPNGCRLTAWIASGVTTTVDEVLQSAGDGTLKPLSGSNYPVARALEAITASALTKIRVEVL